jgi:hypothetical protein
MEYASSLPQATQCWAFGQDSAVRDIAKPEQYVRPPVVLHLRLAGHHGISGSEAQVLPFQM